MAKDTKAARILSISMLAIVVVILIMTDFVDIIAPLYYAYALGPFAGLLLSLFGTKGRFRIIFSLIFLAFIVWFYVVPAMIFLNGDF
ncbi:hypothetical protein [Peribacillus simplex]|uniref:hypothetical protein n=1 Tax=Peribacillus simplex TaxID=1478 RepID=UPI003D2AA487